MRKFDDTIDIDKLIDEVKNELNIKMCHSAVAVVLHRLNQLL
ncbi:MAG: hypothetical protein RSD36_03790 [Terrisporobacter sp.]